MTTAVIAGLTGVAGMVGVSNAVNLNPDGLGQVLLYPYYSARGGNDTLISVVNTTADAKSVKVRFLEALNSREVLDFNLYLSAFDVWAAAITVDDDGTGGRLIIGDSSCTVPYFYGAGTFEDENDRFGTVDFLNFAYTGDFADGATGDIERTESGYLEMIEMGVLTDVDFGSATAATHIPTEFGPRPLDCAQLVEAWTTDTTGGSNTYWNPADDGAGDPNFDHDVPAGGLFGGAAIINVEEGVMFSYNAEAIDAFSSSILHTSPGSLEPDLNSGDNTSNVFIGGAVNTQTWPTGVEAVSATVLYNELMNEYVTNPALNAMSEWVVTFPTKRF
ncbi:MAG: hypothetical protein R3323_06460, partial [Wenzhouxiangellaceae bacterium]|nr:hypothetical protein [Wenzhouxiangellaceae bacterium]